MIPENHYYKIKELLQEALKLSKTKQLDFLRQVAIDFPLLVNELEILLRTEEEQFNEIPEKVGEVLGNLLLSDSFANSSQHHRYADSNQWTNLTIEKQKFPYTNEILRKGDFVNNRYKINSELQKGGLATVYLATDSNLHNRLVVLKVLPNRLNSEAQNWLKNKFLLEIKALSKLHHPNIVAIFDYGILPDSSLFFVMEYIQGYSLRDIISNYSLGLLPEQISVITSQISNALEAAHSLGIYHRDLKPENIMVQFLNNSQIHVKLIDFGIATVKDSITSITGITTIAGTPTYMSPEHLEGSPSALSDIYSLGVVVYEMLTGRPPFNISHFSNFREALSKLKQLQEQGLIVRPSLLSSNLSNQVDEIVFKALSYNPKDRYKQASQFAQALNSFLLGVKTNRSYWDKLFSLAQPTEKIQVIDQHIRERIKSDNNTLQSLTRFPQYVFALNSQLSLFLDLKREGYLILILKDMKEDGLAYCLCPSNYVASDKISCQPTLLPTEGLFYKYFPLADSPGKKQLLAIISKTQIKLNCKASFEMPANIFICRDINEVLCKLQQLDGNDWGAFSTTFNIS
jgi:serine/threonine-protein kinase